MRNNEQSKEELRSFDFPKTKCTFENTYSLGYALPDCTVPVTFFGIWTK